MLVILEKTVKNAVPVMAFDLQMQIYSHIRKKLLRGFFFCRKRKKVDAIKERKTKIFVQF
ncbi:hypothetical protein CPZ30_25310 [Paenibacillus lautus]|nr:hypothetical protein CPZ30_25310 [Paenibacillus lautus]